MSDSSVALHCPAIPSEVRNFADQKGVSGCLDKVIDLVRRAYPSSDFSVSIGQDAEDETHRYIALDVEVTGLATEELLTGQRIWSAGIHRVCCSRDVVYFVLGWR
jgi:hypothetical protein